MITRKILSILALAIFQCMFVLTAEAKTKTKTGTKNIDEAGFVSINGIQQWVTIKGDTSKPAILFIHGGPGSTMSPYAENVYGDWQKDFIIIQWDQRGAGKTFGVNAPSELSLEYLRAHTLTLQQMTQDGVALAGYLTQHLHKNKLILFGTSWGSALAVKIVSEKPELFYAYVGHSQIVNPNDDELLYEKVYQIAQKQHDQVALDTLKKIGRPPYDQARTIGKLFRIVKKYERANSIPAPANWFIPTSTYNDSLDERNREDGDDYSFVHYTGDRQMGIPSMRAGINMMRDNLIFKVPVYLIQGNEDLLTPKESTKAYFDQIKAPHKEYLLLPETAHGFNLSVVDAQYKIFKKIKAG